MWIPRRSGWAGKRSFMFSDLQAYFYGSWPGISAIDALRKMAARAARESALLAFAGNRELFPQAGHTEIRDYHTLIDEAVSQGCRAPAATGLPAEPPRPLKTGGDRTDRHGVSYSPLR